MNIQKILLSIALVSLLFLNSCASITPEIGDIASAIPINMGLSPQPGWMPLLVAEKKEIFAKNNLNIDLKWFEDYSESVEALNVGLLDANPQTLSDTIYSVITGSDPVIVLLGDRSISNHKMIVTGSIDSVTDLKGKKIAVGREMANQLLLLFGLQKAGVSMKEVEIQILDPEAATQAFLGAEVDAISISVPNSTQALKREGSRELFSSADFSGLFLDIFAVTRQTIEERPEQIAKLVKSWFESLNLLETEREKSYEIMADRLNITLEEYKAYEAGVKILSLEENLKGFEAGSSPNSISVALETAIEVLFKNGLIQKKPNIDGMLDDRFIKAYAEQSKVNSSQ